MSMNQTNPAKAEMRRQLAAIIDHTLLKPTATGKDVRALCDEARDNGFFSVCVNPRYVALAKGCLEQTPVKTCTVVGFPLGANTTAIKVAETTRALAEGADEIDMVLTIGDLKAGALSAVSQDIEAVVRAANGAIVKVILETCLLSDGEKETACRLAMEAGAGFVKTSTGFGSGGATRDDVALMRRVVGPEIGVKASGGIRDLAGARAMIAAGANRLGMSAGLAILQEIENSDR